MEGIPELGQKEQREGTSPWSLPIQLYQRLRFQEGPLQKILKVEQKSVELGQGYHGLGL